ncbi:TetR/AcrR family transcriptional regulator [Kribbella sp. NBC_01245]|uniref:TetR/AcrR family transcriptional regulator n=1 Tax=Kribbella sp. NBC_01245 TaxID=2903578 RepID=UPI002E281536|nr:helix-turn-helix domain-containing protein [Kribbella sp. NBC_01245]
MAGRLSRTQAQLQTRGRVLAAAREEFAEHGFRAARVDLIADRAGLTRGAVYSNFPGKRALYFSVLAEAADRPVEAPPGRRTATEALREFARIWVTGLPLELDPRGDARISQDLLPEIIGDETLRQTFGQLMKLDAILLGLALESLRPGRRLVRVAESALTSLYGASQLVAAAPGFVEPFNVVNACERLLQLDFDDWWPPSQSIVPVEPVDEEWAPPPSVDLVTGQPARLDRDGVVTVLGLERLEAAEDAVRAGAATTLVIPVDASDERAPLTRLVIAEVSTCLREAFPASAWPALQVVLDPSCLGIAAAGDRVEVAVRIRGGRVVARAAGRGAGHVVASADIKVTL